MNKHIYGIISKSIAVVAFLLISCLIIWAADNRALPFYNNDNNNGPHTEVSLSDVSVPEHSQVVDISKPKPTIDFSDNLRFIEQNDQYPEHAISDKVYDKNNTVFTFAKQEIPTDGIMSMVPRMGYIFITKTDGTVSLWDASGETIFDVLPVGYEFAGVRDFQNRPLFVSNNKYYYIKDNVFDISSYTAGKDDRGISFDYPSYYGASDGTMEIYRYNNSWGIRYNVSKGVVLYPGYKEAYYFNEGYAIAVAHNNTMSIIDSRKIVIGQNFLAPLTKGIESLGYFYFDHGLTRVRVLSNGKSTEQLMYPDFTKFNLLPDFELVHYYNGVLTLKKGDRYGYMRYTGEWLANADMIAASPFIEGVAVFKSANGKYGMLDLDGRTLLPAEFDYISDCSGGIIVAYEKDHGYFIINKRVPEQIPDETSK